MLVRIKSSVKIVLVIFCGHGLAFIKQIFNGLNRFNSICSILIYCTGKMNENEIKSQFPNDLKNLTVQFAKEDKDAYQKLEKLVTAAKDGSFRQERDKMEIKENDLINKQKVKS